MLSHVSLTLLLVTLNKSLYSVESLLLAYILFPNLLAFWFCLFAQIKINNIYTHTDVIIYPDTILEEKSLPCVSSFLKHAGKVFTNKWGKCFNIYSIMVLLCCSYTLSTCNCHHKVRNIPSCVFMPSFFSETQIKSLPRLSRGYSCGSSGLVERVHFISKTCSIKRESYNPIQNRNLRRTFPKNLRLNFKSFLLRIPFLWAWVNFRSTFFLISFCKRLVCSKLLFFCQTNSFGVFPNFP